MDLEVKSMVRVQKEIYWASPQEPRFLGENPPFPRQAPFLSASLPQASLTTRSKFPSFWFHSRLSNGKKISPWSSPHPL